MGQRLKAERLLPRTLLALVALGGVLLAQWSGPADAATTFTVNKTGDAGDRRISDSVCDSSRDRSNQCTLRAAIQESNDTLGADTIKFNIGGTTPVKTISPASALPTITEALTINGYTQSGASANTLAEGNDAVLKVQLNGTNAGAGTNGLVIQAADGTIKGLVINRFGGNGILISRTGATANKVQGNFVGTNATGTQDLGNSNNGVFISSASNNTVGGTAAGAHNTIARNDQDGIEIFGESTGNKVEGNFIANNTGSGVFVFAAANNFIGGATSAHGNTIVNNGGDGILINGSEATENTVLSNRIFDNAGLGIDLVGGTENGFGVTANDAKDPDTGANNRQNFPVIGSAVRSSTTGFTTISGTLNSNPSQPFTIQCFVAAPDPSGHGEGQIPIGQTTATTDSGGDDSFACPVSPVPQLGQAVTATATNTATGDTSEFSLNVGVVAGP